MRVGGLDVGQLADPSVLATLHATEGANSTCWIVDGIHALPLKMPFSAQLRALQPHLERLDHLAFDAGGVGQSLGENIHGARLQSLVPMVIVGGTAKGKPVNGRVTVGKTVLIRGMMEMIHLGELRVAPDAPGRDLLRAEMTAFEYLPDGRFRRMAAQRGQHDDAVMAVALGAYLARRIDQNIRGRPTGLPLTSRIFNAN